MAAEVLSVKEFRFRLQVTLEPWLAAGKFASTHDALAAAFTQADPEESARRLKLREYRAARELQFEKSTRHSGSHSDSLCDESECSALGSNSDVPTREAL